MKLSVGASLAFGLLFIPRLRHHIILKMVALWMANPMLGGRPVAPNISAVLAVFHTDSQTFCSTNE